MGENNAASFEDRKKAAMQRFEKQKERIDNAMNNFKNGKCQNQRDETSGSQEQKNSLFSLNEDKFLVLVVCTSAVIVCLKILHANREIFRRLYRSGSRLLFIPLKLAETEVVVNIFSAITIIWGVFVDLSWLFVPALIGVATTYFTWRIVYLDSQIPGVKPATPFSPQAKSMKTYLMGANGYTFALWIGIIVFIVLLFTALFA